MKVARIIIALFVLQIVCLFVPTTLYGQTELLDGVTYSPPKGWTKTVKEGAVVYTDINKAANTFCVLTVYGLADGSGDPKKDFTAAWKEFIVTPFAADANPKIQSQPAADGWTGTVGGSLIDMNGIRSAAVLTVFSGYGKTASVLAIFNDESYSAQMQAIIDSVRLDRIVASTNPPPSDQTDPFPNRPGRNGQKPLTGTLKPNITMADLAGNWDQGAGSVLSYVDSSTGDYAGTSTSFYGEQYIIKADGTFAYKFTGRANNSTVRESDSGTVALSGSFITFKFVKRAERRFQFIAYMTNPNGVSILSVVPLNKTSQGISASDMDMLCGHGKGYITCVGSEEWAKRGAPVSSVSTSQPVNAPIEHWTILREYQDNQVGADAKYGGKRVTIVGPMDMVLIENGKPVIRMGVPAWSGRQMFCIFPVSQKSAVATLRADQQVVLECTVLGIAGGVSKVGRVDLGSSVGRLTLDNCILR